MAPDGSRGMRNSCATVKNRNALKKGPWTASEDMMLIEYVKRHGEGNWNAVQRNSSLMRCGKSCRLRWANHLRPNLKKGAFSPEEERLIIELHAKLGNKWARMAAQLPGRTDNEIKNYWNTRLKRRQRAGLPIYPQELQQEILQQYNNSSSPNSLSSLLNSSHPTDPNLCFYETFQSPPKINPSQQPCLNQQLKLYRNNNGSLALSLAAPNSSFSSSNFPMPPYFYRARPNSQLPTPSFIPYNCLNFGIDVPYPNNVELGLSSVKSTENAAVTPSASSSNYFMATSSDEAEDREVKPGGSKTGLLEDMLGESQNVTCNEKPKVESFVAAAAEDMDEKAASGIGPGHAANDEGKEKKAAGQGTNPVDEDLLNLLDNFPLSVPIPEWNGGNGQESPHLTNGTNDAVESQPSASQYKPVANISGAANQDWNLGAKLWNNMPSIY